MFNIRSKLSSFRHILYNNIKYNNNKYYFNNIFLKNKYPKYFHTNNILLNNTNNNDNNDNNNDQNQTKQRPMFGWMSLIVTISISGSLYWWLDYQKKKLEKAELKVTSVQSSGVPLLGGPFALVNQDGKIQTNEDFYGNFVLLYFGFTHCPDICPNEMVRIGAIMDELDERDPKLRVNKESPKPIFISIDPDRDSIGQLKHYGQDFHPKVIYLTGTKEQIADVSKKYRVYFDKTMDHDEEEEDYESYLVDHTVLIYLLDPEGKFVAFFSPNMKAQAIVEKIEEEYRKYYLNK